MSLYENIHQTDNCDEEYLTKVVINPMSRTFNLYGSFGSHKTIECDVDEFSSIRSRGFLRYCEYFLVFLYLGGTPQLELEG